MFGSAILDLAIGLVFTFLAVSLAASAITEMIASITKWRSITLRKGIKDLLNDPRLDDLGRRIYQHALVNPRADGSEARATRFGKLPAYIDPRNFAHALMDVVGLADPATTLVDLADPAITRAAIKERLDMAVPDAQLNTLLKGIVDRTGGDAEKMSEEIARWFDSAMDRVSGVYKRRAQLISFIVALLFAAVLNISAVHVAERLWKQPIDMATITRIKAEDIKDQGTADKALDKVLRQLKEVDALSTSIGWKDGDAFESFWETELRRPTFDTASRIIGWLITALATLFGAPFWFDALQQIIRLKGAGPSPQEKKEDKGAAA